MDNTATTQKTTRNLQPLCTIYFEHIGVTATFIADSKEADANFKLEACKKGRTISQHMCEEILLDCVYGGLGEFED